jgi:Zn-dependent alcohol dehydrogenase
MISESYPLDRINEAMQAMASYQVVKAAIKFQ